MSKPRLNRRTRSLRPTESLEDRCLLATITVTSAADAIADDGMVTLREAILAANEDRSVDGSTAGSGSDEIVFAESAGSAIDLVAGAFEISSDVTIRAGGNRMVLDAGDGSRHFDVTGSGVTVEFDNLAMINGNAGTGSGGAILVTSAAADSGSAVTVRDSAFTDNSAAGPGGAIHLAGSDAAGTPQASVTIVDSAFTANETTAGSGGAILVTGHVDLSLSGSTFVRNTAGQNGGAVMVFDADDAEGGPASTATVVDTEFHSNIANTTDTDFGGWGGGFHYFGGGLATVAESTFTNNEAGRHGGGLSLFTYLEGPNFFQISDSLFEGNIARFGGGVAGDQLEMTDSVVRGNFITVSGSTGGIFADEQLTARRILVANNRGRGIGTKRLQLSDSRVVGNVGRSVGGGVSLTGTSTIVRSVIDNNTARNQGGGLFSSAGTVLIRDSRIAFNSAGVGFSSDGGGIYAFQPKTLTLDRASIVGNATTDSGSGGGVAVEVSARTLLADSSVVIRNSTIADNTTGGQFSRGSGVHIDFSHFETADSFNFEALLHNNTITGNKALHELSPAGGVFVTAEDGADSTRLVVSSSIIAANETATADDDLVIADGFDSITIEHTLLGNNSGSGLAETGLGNPDTNGNVVGSASNPIDPMLQPVATYNGILAVQALLAGSPAIDAGSNPQGYSEDNRGSNRLQGAAVDMGAFEGIGTGLIEVPSVTVEEPDAGSIPAEFEVTLMGTSAADVVLDFTPRVATASAGDLDLTPGSLTLAGTDNETGAFTVPVSGDTLPEREELFRVDVTTTSEDVGVLFTERQGTGTITDTDIGVAVSGGELLILGTAADDVVRISTGDFRYSVELNGETVVVSQAAVSSAFVRTFGGNDEIDLQSLLVPAFVQGDVGRDTIIGTSGRDTIYGGSGSDFIDGGPNANLLFGGAGNDSLRGGNSNDTIDGGAGDDEISGSFGEDVLSGGTGDDLISGGNSSDTLVGDEGSDTLIGGSGHDRLTGSRGMDSLVGGAGNDRLIGGYGDDRLDGGSGNDSMEGSRGNDVLLGRVGDDTLSGGIDDDTLIGAEGNDILLGGDGDDSLAGSDGNDILIGQAGTDTIKGNDGDDLLVAGTLDNVFLQSGFSRLESIQSEWVSDRSYAQRVKNIRGSSGQSDDRRNGFVYFRPLAHVDNNVFDDGDPGDRLSGDDGSDYFFAHRRGENLDTVFKDADEFLNQI